MVSEGSSDDDVYPRFVRFTETAVPGAYVVDIEPYDDDRGFFARSFCVEEFAAHGITFAVNQANISFNRRAGTLRGMHFQAAPVPDPKVVRCVRGAILDAIVDTRTDSPAHGTTFTVELDADNRRALVIPGLVAHGFQTLVDGTEVHYLMGAPFVSGLADGVRYDSCGIEWPLPVSTISERDVELPPFRTPAPR